MLQMYLKMSYTEIYKLPVKYRHWFLKRLEKHYSDQTKKSEENPEPINNKGNFKKFENMLQNKFKNN
jgi:hypothetical protein